MQRKILVICFVCFVLLGWGLFDQFNRARSYKLHANEALLKEDLYSMRQAIDHYTHDKGKPPQTLGDIVSAGYLRAIPKDPFTNRTDTWQTHQEDALTPITENPHGITDVESGSTLPSSDSDGKAYSSW